MTRQCSEDQYLICIVWLRYWQRVVCSSILPWSSLLGHDPISNIHSLSAPVSNAGQVTLTIVSPSIVVITIGSGGILRCIHTLLHSLTPVSTTCAELSWAGAPVSTLSVECWMGNCELCDSVSRPLVLVCDTDNMWQWWWDSTWPGSQHPPRQPLDKNLDSCVSDTVSNTGSFSSHTHPGSSPSSSLSSLSTSI